MKRFAIALVFSSLASACATISAPVDVAERTTLDEQAAIAVEAAYGSTRTALEIAVDAGQLTGDRAARAAELDRRAYLAVVAVRSAYNAGNANGYADALTDAHAAVVAALASIKGQ